MLNLEKRAPGTIQMADGTDGVLFYDTNDNLAIKLNNGNVVYVALSELPAPKVFKGLISQAGSDNPDIDIIINTTGATITPTRLDVGHYLLTASSPIFTEEKTFVQIGAQNINADGAEVSIISHFWVSTTQIKIYSRLNNSGTFALGDDTLFDNPISIEIYE